MSTRQEVAGNRPAAVLLVVRAAAAMSLLCRCRAFHHHSGSSMRSSMLLLHRHPPPAAAAAFTTSSAATPTRVHGRMTNLMMAFATSSARTKLSRTTPTGAGAGWGALGGGRSGQHAGGRAQPSRRRPRTSLGMRVSDQPFKAPRAEPMESMEFRELGLLEELVEAMDEFGERETFDAPHLLQQSNSTARQ